MKQTLSAAVLCPLLAFMTGCAGSAQDNSPLTVTAQIDGLTCEACEPLLTTALQREFKNASIKVDDTKNVATVRFASAKDYSEDSMRTAAEAVRMRVVNVLLERTP